MAEHYDVIIIGTGAGGGTMAHTLAPSGKRILLIERGEFLPREADNWNTRAVMVERKYANADTYYDGDGQPFAPSQNHFVGGNTKFYGAVLLRLREQDFGEVQHADGVSPAWPLSYADFEPYYSRAEHLYSVHGKHGADPYDPPFSREYPFAPVPHDPRIALLAQDFERTGHRPFPLPLGVNIDSIDNAYSPFLLRELYRAQGRDTFDGFPDLAGLKADAETICVRPALRHSNVTLLTGAKAIRLETKVGGHEVSGVTVERNDTRETYNADLVVVACGAIQSAALLLRSASTDHPNGLGNAHDQVGRYYMSHNSSALVAISRRPNPSLFQKTLAVSDYYFSSKRWEYPMGFIQMLGKTDAHMLEGMDPVAHTRMERERLARYSVDFWLQSEDLPRAENRVALRSDGNIGLHYTPNNVEAHERLTATLKQLLSPLDCEEQLFDQPRYMGARMSISNVGHQCGTLRFGTDPHASALDLNCRVHGIDNLYVSDSSFMVSSGAVNPTLTIIANALRVGDHLLERM
jgi:choline dehydrogenase-like flavoprotein